MDLRDARDRLVTSGAAAGTGALLHAAGMPLAWLLGALLGAAAVALTTGRARAIPHGRPAGQLVVGAAIGIQMTMPVLLAVLERMPFIVAAAVLATVTSTLGALLLMRLGNADAPTAFFASMPGGVAEMATMGAALGARRESVAVIQTLRVALIVAATPFIVLHLPASAAASAAGAGERLAMAWTAMAGLAVGGFAVARLFARWRVPNAWLIGPLLAGAVLSAGGLVAGGLPGQLLNIAQFLIGASLGARFRRDTVLRLPRLVAAGTLMVTLTAGTMASAALALAWAKDWPPAMLVLATAPAGMAEMVLTGGVLGLDVGMITGFHAVRIVLVVLSCRLVYALFRHLAPDRIGDAGPSNA